VKLHDWSNEENVAGLRDGRLNLAFVVRPPKAASLEGIRFEELIRERICLAVPSAIPLRLILTEIGRAFGVEIGSGV
jgi:DNA-binding transcriptional LysR family regulator